MSDDLGMKRPISRRDFLQASALTTLAPAIASAAPTDSESTYYPPAQTGLRGSHPGSFEVAHQLGLEGKSTWPAPEASEDYDLIVVGGGVSGLAAAYYYRQQKADARILILDNHDDFGGHAKRNEFTVNGQHLIGYGGSQSMEAPSAYSDEAKQLLAQLQVDLEGFETSFDQDFYQNNGLGLGLYFDEATWGRNALTPANALLNSGMLGFATSKSTPEAALAAMPLSAQERAELNSLMNGTEDALPDISLNNLTDYLYSISYETFLTRHIGIRSARLLEYLRPMPGGYFGLGTDATPAFECMMFGFPGLNRTGVPGADWLVRQAGKWLVEPYIYHYPDGNASIARSLVRSLIPETATTSKPADLVRSRFDYSQLDKPEHNVRIRLSSTALNVENAGNGVRATYARGGRIFEAKASQCVLACYNMMIPHLCPDLPAAQREALSSLVKAPLVYSNVALTNWRALKKSQTGMVFTPGMFHDYFMIDFPVSIGGYQFSRSEDEPVVLHFSKAMIVPGLSAREQHRAGRAELLGTTFETMERDLRMTLAGAYGSFGFDPESDISAITVNRWPHGYAYTYNSLFDPEYALGEAPHEIGRARFGNIAIANSDAGARAYLDEAINQAHRAVGELTS